MRTTENKNFNKKRTFVSKTQLKHKFMELLYVWIEKYKNIEKQGFNFSSKYRFSFDDKTKTLSLDEDRSDKVIDDFFGKRISNITAIVGENGSGKSNLCEFLLESFNNLGVSNEYRDLGVSFLVFGNKSKNNYKFYLYYYFNFSETEIITKGFESEKVEKLNNINCVYYSQHLNRDGNSGLKGIDVSNYAKFYYDPNIENVTIFNYQKQETITILEFFLFVNGKFDLNLLKKINIPKQFSIQIVIGRVEKITDFFINKFGEVEKWNDQTEAVHHFFFGSKSNIGYMILRQISKQNNFDIKINEIGSKILKMEVGTLGNRVDFNQVVELCESISYLKTELDKILYFNFENQYETTISLKIPPSDDFLKKFQDFYDNYFYILSVEWEYTLATGFNNLISFASRCYVEARRKAFGKQPLTLIIDEGETGLHPNLQRQYLSIILEFLNQDFVFELEKGVKTQIIIATHSPFILSDLPKENVIFLFKNEVGKCEVQNGLSTVKQTFGANIHTLLSDGFFMDGLIGEFANTKIREVIEKLNKFKKKKEVKKKKNEIKNEIKDENNEIKNIINMIDEPIIAQKLHQMYDEIFGEKTKKEFYQSQIDLYNQKLNALNDSNKSN